ncbi:hypothetical protein NHH03_18630 [Stieleria sp. TO1_6]|uniref:hypothetical protein n=1 Tax=Stieleria tagensis TaxID=2956795 RepID=UPI00209A8845|nr:hypothetical protein [Stieleria tagensis]MCO8123769.1 hypothetical protein [Stieleria tagensis]
MNEEFDLPPDLREFEQSLRQSIPSRRRSTFASLDRQLSVTPSNPGLRSRWPVFIAGCAVGILLGVCVTAWLMPRSPDGNLQMAETTVVQPGDGSVPEATESQPVNDLMQPSYQRLPSRDLHDGPLRVASADVLAWDDESGDRFCESGGVGIPGASWMAVEGPDSHQQLTARSRFPLSYNFFPPRG